MNHRSPYWTKVLNDFVSFCDQYHAGFQQSIRGASTEEVEDLVALTGILFPPEYHAFLYAMGHTRPHSVGQFLRYSTYGIQAVRELYNTPGIRPPQDAVYLWTYEVDAPYDIFIRTGGGECDVRPLVQVGWPVNQESGSLLNIEPDEIVLGGSLPQSLYKDAFLSLRDPLLPHQAELREFRGAEISEESRLRRRAGFQTVADQLGFQMIPYMNENLVFYDRSDASLKLYGQLGADVIYVRANDKRVLGQICEILSDNLGMVVWG